MNQDIEFNRNEDVMKTSISKLKKRLSEVSQGGGKKAIDKQHEKNKLTARERIAYLCDDGKPFMEIGSFAGYEMYA
ncbi:MAG: acyl-CoA carboxylase subunit beta, partial [Sphingobacteriales bacterium]